VFLNSQEKGKKEGGGGGEGIGMGLQWNHKCEFKMIKMKTICTNQKTMFMVQIAIKVMHKLNHTRHTHMIYHHSYLGGAHHSPPYNIICT
jgi:hypothetical protein